MSSAGSNLVVKATLTADGKGLTGAAQQATSDLNQVKAAAQGVTEAGRQMEAATSRAGVSFRSLQQGIDVSHGLDREIKSASDSYSVFTQTMRGQSAILAASTRGTQQHTEAIKLNRQQQLALSYTLHDVIASMASGLPIQTIALQQGGQLADAFNDQAQRAQIFRAALTSTWTWLGLTAVAFGLVAANSYRYEQAIDRLSAATTTYLPEVSLTRDQLTGLVSDIANVGNASKATARDMAQQFAQGGITPKAWADLAAAAREYADATGTDLSAATEVVLASMKKGAKGLDELNQSMGVTSQQTTDYIRRLEEQHRAGEAQVAQAKAMKDGMSGLGDSTDAVSKRTDAFLKTISDANTNLLELSRSANQFGNSKWEQDYNVSLQEQETQAKRTGDALRAKQKAQAEEAALFQQLVPQQRQFNEYAILAVRIQNDMAAGYLSAADGARALAVVQERLIGLQKLLSSNPDNDFIDNAYKTYVLAARQAGDEHFKLRMEVQNTALSEERRAKASEALAFMDKKAAAAAASHAHAVGGLRTETDQWEQRIKSLLVSSEQSIAQVQLQASGARDLADAVLVSSLAYQQVIDKQAQERAALPFVTAALHAQGEERKKLLAIAQQMRDETADAQQAQHFAETINDIKSAMQGLSDTASLGAIGDALALGRKDIEDWKEKSLASLDQTKAGYSDFVRYVGEVYDDRMAQLYERDLQRRKDWAAGVIRANLDITRSHQDMASKSEAFLTQWDRNAEDVFVQFATTGKFQIGSLVDFAIEQFMRLAYEKYLAQSFNALGSSILDGFSSLLGLGGSSGGSSWSLSSSFISGARAGGGPVTAGHRYLVGEKGPEILEVPADGYIHPNNQLVSASTDRPMIVSNGAATAGSGVPPVVNNFNFRMAEGFTAREGQRTQNSSGGFDMEVMVDYVDDRIAGRIHKGHSATGQMLEQVYKVQRGGR